MSTVSRGVARLCQRTNALSRTKMNTDQAATNVHAPMLDRYLSHQDQSQLGVQGRLVLGTPAPSVAEKTTEMNIKLEGLGYGTVAVNFRHDEMAVELDGLLGGK